MALYHTSGVYTVNAGDVISSISENISNVSRTSITKEDYKNMSDSNKVYKCERCGQFYTEGEIYQHLKEDAKDREQYLYVVRHLDNGPIGLCPDCMKALSKFIAPLDKDEVVGYSEATPLDENAIQKMVIKMMVDKAWEELKKPGTDA